MMVWKVVNREENLVMAEKGFKANMRRGSGFSVRNLFVMDSSLFFSSNMFVNCRDFRREVVPRRVSFPPVSSSIKDATNILRRQRKTHLEEMPCKHPSPNRFSSSGCHERPFRQGPLNATYLLSGNKQMLWYDTH